MPYTFKKQVCYCFLLIAAIAITACNKATVNFGEEALTDDPNIIYIDTMSLAMGTFQQDSMYTAGDTIFIAGVHVDSLFGKYEARSYMQIGLSSANSLNGCNNCTFDSIAFIARFSGSYYGDTTEAFTLSVHAMTEQMIADETSIGYNTSSFNYDPVPLGSITFNHVQPAGQQNVSVRLSDSWGKEIFGMLQRNADTITDATKFYKYFNGITITGKGANQRSLYYFNHAEPASAVVIRLYYRQNGATPIPGTIDFGIAPTAFQFNNFSYDKTGTALEHFIPKKKQLIASAETNNQVFLHGNSGLSPQISIPGLFALKELHPYIKVIKAELEITPPLLNYGYNSYYPLPPQLYLFNIDEEHNLGSLIYDASGGTPQTGNLVIDDVYHKDTRYTYDLTSYVNNILTHGKSSQESLVLRPASNAYENRLILNAAPGNSSVKFKVYVLGL